MARYIELDALVAEINKGINGRNDWQLDQYRKGYHDALIMLKKYLSILEVKKVDLQSEIDRVWDYTSDNFLEDGWKEFEDIAKHFFELGLSVSNKAQKGE